MNVAPYDRVHDAFTLAEVRRCSSKFPYATPGANQTTTGRWLVDRARRCIVGNPSGCLVAIDTEDPDVILGVILSHGPQQLTWLYVKHAVRRRGIATELARLVGLDFSQTTYVEIWTYACSRIAAKGYRLVYQIWENGE